ncbi:MAG TPA: hypothetical protein PLF56_04025 [Micropruina sp.]|nr:hypothetical protein [Micropruina sp.]
MRRKRRGDLTDPGGGVCSAVERTNEATRASRARLAENVSKRDEL